MQTEKVAMLIDGGMIRYFGVSVYTEREFALALENPMVKIIQIPFNIFDQRAVDGGWFKKARDTGKLLFIRSIFLQGLFFMHTEELKGSLVSAAPFLDKMHRIRQKLGLSVSQFAMAYVNAASTDAVLLFGCDTQAQAKENIENFNTLPSIDTDMQKEINQFFSEVPATVYNPSQWKVT
jgi:aryl-alcohol dehydrogenase-like predicted oxidoreductase